MTLEAEASKAETEAACRQALQILLLSERILRVALHVVPIVTGRRPVSTRATTALHGVLRAAIEGETTGAGLKRGERLAGGNRGLYEGWAPRPEDPRFSGAGSNGRCGISKESLAPSLLRGGGGLLPLHRGAIVEKSVSGRSEPYLRDRRIPAQLHIAAVSPQLRELSKGVSGVVKEVCGWLLGQKERRRLSGGLSGGWLCAPKFR
jgi:hypothetical protein